MNNTVSRADILQYLNNSRGAELASILDCFGYKSKPPEREKKFIELEVPDEPSQKLKHPEKQEAESKPEQKRPPEYFHTVSEDKPSELLSKDTESDDVAMPEWVDEINNEPLDLSAPIRPANEEAPKKLPLVAWARLWPVLRQQLSDQQTKNKPDIPRLIQHVAMAKQNHRIPKLQQRHWSDRIILLKDRPSRLNLFNQDYNDIETQLQLMRGKEAIDSYLIDNYPNGRVFSQGSKQQWKMPTPDVPIMILSDLGVYDETGQASQQWLRFGRALKAAGCTATVLMPVPVRYLSHELSLCFQCIVWDRYSAFTVLPPTGHSEEAITQQKQQDAAHQKVMLRLLSVANEIDANLIRAMRYEIDYQVIEQGHVHDVASEAMLWNHPDREPASNFIVITPEKHQAYKAELIELLNQHADIAQQVYSVLKANLSHKRYFDFYEALFCIADTLKVDSDKTLQKVDHYLKQFTLALHKHAENAGLLYQAYYFLERQSHTQKQNNPYLSSLWAIIKRCAKHDNPRPDNVNVQAAHAFLKSNEEIQQYQLIQWGECLLLGTKAALEKQQVAGFAAKGQLLAEFETSQSHIVEEREGLIFDHYVSTDQPYRFSAYAETRNIHFAQRCLSISPLRCVDDLGGISCNAKGVHVPSLNPTGRDNYGEYIDISFAGVVQRFRYIEAGTFMMGSPHNERERYDDDEDLHQVTLSQGYWLADTTVTQRLWQAVMKNNPSEFKGDDFPVDSVSWEDAQQFIQQLSQGSALLSVRLPSEAEWENACRAGSQTRYHFGNKISSEQVRYNRSLGSGAVSVKSLPGNDWGLYEMHGNVWEWCEDYWQENLGEKAVNDPINDKPSDSRVLRGGSWLYNGWDCRSEIRNRAAPDNRNDTVGFRLALGHLSTSQVQQEQAGSLDDEPLRDEADKHLGGQPAERKEAIKKFVEVFKD